MFIEYKGIKDEPSHVSELRRAFASKSENVQIQRVPGKPLRTDGLLHAQGISANDMSNISLLKHKSIVQM